MDINGWTLAIIMVTVVCFALEVSVLASGAGVGTVGAVAGIGIATVLLIFALSNGGLLHQTHATAHTKTHTTPYVQHQSSHRSQGG